MERSFRLEFLVPGVAALAAIATVALAIESKVERAEFAPFLGTMLESSLVANDVLRGIIFGIALTGLSYVLGIVLVMLTFRLVAQRMIVGIRKRRIRQLDELAAERSWAASDDIAWTLLRDLAKAQRGGKQPADAATGGGSGGNAPREREAEEASAAQASSSNEQVADGSSAIRDWMSGGWRPSAKITEPKLGVLMACARAVAAPGVIKEYEYRRYLRQLAAGSMPAFLLFAVALLVADLEVLNMSEAEQWLTKIVGVALSVLFLGALFRSVHYQEETAQRLLLDTLFLRAHGSTAERHS